VLLRGRTGERVVHDTARAETRFLPASTFKVANALIALETGVSEGAEFSLSRDPLAAPRQAWWPDAWNREHTMRSALTGSVVWYYQEIARRIGADRMREHLLRFEYGNGDLSSGIDRFWLEGGFGISANEQVEFMRRFHQGELGVSRRSTRVVREMLVLEEGDGYRLSGKTGWAGFGEPDAPQLGWLVGYVERGDEVAYFALNLDLRTPADAAARLSITRGILTELGLLPGDAR
jgi:beta-lactamase class D